MARSTRIAVALAMLFNLQVARPQPADLVKLVEQAPVSISEPQPGVFLLDFGRVAFGNLLLPALHGSTATITVRFGEHLQNGRVDTEPPGSVRYAQVEVAPGAHATVVAPPANIRNTTSPAVLTPTAWDTLIPFRWVEIQNLPATIKPEQIRRRAAFDSTWIDDAANFRSSDALLDRIWDLSHYSIKATTFAGLFVDGDRERIAYEGDAYLNQLGYYAGDANPRMVRDTFDRLVQFPTWPSEWAPHMVFIAYADWMQTGDRAWLAAHYEVLKTKILADRVGPDGLVMSTPAQIRKGDLVDWPESERDHFVFTPVNTVVNAFRLRALEQLIVLATALDKPDDAATLRIQKSVGEAAFEAKLFDPSSGLYRDGIGTDHASLHANLFPLAFGLVPGERRAAIAHWLASRGMAGSVYAAQYLLQGLLENGQATAAINLMTAPGDRSWRHMVESGSTITWEAWDQKYKPNLDWTHAWGAAPANLLPRFILGVQPLSPGWGKALVQPHPGALNSAGGRIPTPRGTVQVSWVVQKTFRLRLQLPSGMTADLRLPAQPGSRGVWVNSSKVQARRDGTWWRLDRDVSGNVDVEVR